MDQQIVTIDQRTAILDGAVQQYVKRGFRVISRTDTTAQLVKPKKFSFIWAVLWFLVFGVGLLIYVFYYMAKKDETLYLEVDTNGNIRRTK